MARGALALLVATTGYVTVAQSFAETVARRNPALGYAMAPAKGQLAAELAEKQFKAMPTGDAGSSAARLSLEALRHDPTAVKAVAVLGLQAQLRGDVAAARREFAYSQLLSRRDFATQLWAVEDAVARGDIPGALRHYDIALRTTRAAADVMFPVLAGAISDPRIRANLVATMARKPVWSKAFIDYLVDHGSDVRATGALYADLRRVDVPISTEADAAVVKGFLADDAASAWRYYASIRREVDPRRLRDPGFTANLTTPTPFDWTATTDPNLAASFQRHGDGGVFDFATVAGAAGLLLHQIQMLPAGQYRLDGHSIGIDQPDAMRPYWTLTCRGGSEIGRVPVPNSSLANGQFSGTFTVPAGCPVQVLALLASPTDQISGVSGQFDRVRLAPAR
ncbi:hypothetical protein ACBY01_11725 [Sphingomonas sp. ac-8]|uniref:hypothetical protein n=1 Tax=Sphingomonas sp. ac-8 TaxID=3242977 RepID=UPI003A80FCD6